MLATITLIINFIISLPKIWAIFNEMSKWIENHNESKRQEAIEKAKRDLVIGKTQEDRENAANDFIDND